MIMIAVRAITQLPGQSRRSRAVVDLTCKHTNHKVLVEGPEITIRPVGARRVTGGSRRTHYDYAEGNAVAG